MGTYIRLVDYGSQQEKENAFLAAVNNTATERIEFTTSEENFSKIPGSPIAYWVSENGEKAFLKGKSLSMIAQPKQGMVTRDNNRFMRIWWEISFTNCELFAYNHEDSKKSDKKWYPCTSGGSYRKWYGNNESVVNYKNDGIEIIGFSGSHIKNRDFYFRESITWSAISSAKIAMRYAPYGFLPEHAGNCLYGTENQLIALQAFSNCKAGLYFLEILSPTLNYNVGDVANLPIIDDVFNNTVVENITKDLRINSKTDWDSFETSWDFKKNPLI